MRCQSEVGRACFLAIFGPLCPLFKPFSQRYPRLGIALGQGQRDGFLGLLSDLRDLLLTGLWCRLLRSLGIFLHRCQALPRRLRVGVL